MRCACHGAGSLSVGNIFALLSNYAAQFKSNLSACRIPGFIWSMHVNATVNAVSHEYGVPCRNSSLVCRWQERLPFEILRVLLSNSFKHMMCQRFSTRAGGRGFRKALPDWNLLSRVGLDLGSVRGSSQLQRGGA